MTDQTPLSESQIALIAANPFDVSKLDSLRNSLAEEKGKSSVDLMLLVLDLLQTSPAIRFLTLLDGRTKLRVILSQLEQLLQDGDLEVESLQSLADCITVHCPDRIIWETTICLATAHQQASAQDISTQQPYSDSPALDLKRGSTVQHANSRVRIPRVREETLPSPSTPARQDRVRAYPSSGSTYIPRTSERTPFKTSSSRLGDDELGPAVEVELFNEIRTCVYRDVQGFLEKHFNSQSWGVEQKHMFEVLLNDYHDGRWTSFPAGTSESEITAGFRTLHNKIKTRTSNNLGTTASAGKVDGSRWQMDMFYASPTAPNNPYRVRDFLVVGELKSRHNANKFKPQLLQLTRYVRDIFAAQPHRLYVHAFTLCGTTMEAWVFDRSGLYSSKEFDIHAEYVLFAKVIVTYATLENSTMTIPLQFRENGSDGLTAEVALDEQDGAKRVFTLTGPPVVSRGAVVSRATTCYFTADGHFAKFAWTPGSQCNEIKLLQKAQQPELKGVVSLLAFRTFTTIADLRGNMIFADPHNFKALMSDKANRSMS